MRARSGMTLVLAAAVVSLLTAVVALAADAGFSSYITPFPASERYRLYVFGDSLAAGLVEPLTANLATQGVDVVNKTAPGLGLARNDGTEWDKVIDTLPPADVLQIAVLQFGADDRGWIKSGTKRLDPGTAAWTQEYGRRVDALLKALHARNVAVYWLGLPSMRTDGAKAAAQAVNRIFVERVRLSGAKYIDTWGGFVDADGAYSDQGPDMTGIVKPLRMPDGVHMTAPGYQKLANFAEREISHDLTVAHREREVPLAGDETEQQNVRDESLPRRSEAAGVAAGKAAKLGKTVKDYPADDGSVVVSAGKDGATAALPIVRPPIPGAVVAQIQASRTTQQSEPGHTMPADLMGGFTVMSSIETSLDAGRGGSQQLPLTENPFYKLLIRGDALPAKPGRVDDFAWPRPGSAPPDDAAPPEPRG